MTMMTELALPGEEGFSAALRALLSTGGAVTPLERLHLEALAKLGAGHRLALEIELHLAAQRDLSRSAEEALADWTDLAERAARQLAEYDPTMMVIRSQYVRRVARRGRPGDLDHVVALRDAEVAGRIAAGVSEHWVGIARAELAVALLHRATFGSLDPQLVDHDPDGDLAGAAELIDHEVARRAEQHGSEHPFTWRARGVRGSVLVGQAMRAGEPTRAMLGGEALVVAEALMQHEWYRRPAHTAQALRGQLLRAVALSTLDRYREAECEARLAAVLSRRYRPVDTAMALMVLAHTLAPTDRAAALSTAKAALATRRQWFPAQGYRVAQAQRLVDSLS